MASRPRSTAQPPEDRELWEKLPGESMPAYRNFCHYRDLLSSRSLARAARDLSKAIPTLSEQSVRYRWQERVDAFDLYLDRRYREARESETERAQRRHASAGVRLQMLAVDRLQGNANRVDSDGRPLPAIEALDPAELDALAVARLLEVGQRMERISLGLATDLLKGTFAISAKEFQETLRKVIEVALALLPEEKQALFIAQVTALGA